MPKHNFLRRLMTRSVRPPKPFPFQRQLEQLEDRTVPALIAHYTFDNTSNLGQDSSASGNNLVAVGSPGSTTSGGLFGGGALSLSGTPNYLKQGATSPTGVPTGNSAYTVSVWVQPTGTNRSGMVSWGNFSGN